MKLSKDLKIRGRALYREPLYKHTTIRIGGPCEVWVEPLDEGDLKAALEALRHDAAPVFPIGGGSNLLVPDEGVGRIFISLKNTFGLFSVDNGRISSGSGAGLQQFILAALGAGYSGLEFMAGIPGSVGGALKMNAGAGLKGPWILDFVESLRVCDPQGRISVLPKKAIRSGYRASGLGDSIILEAEFNLKKAGNKDTLLDRYKKFLAEKKNKQELSVPSAGCVFKNPPPQADQNLTAAQMIDKCGLKGARIGGAVVSNKHANFIINAGKAGFRDVMGLIELIRSEAYKRFGVRLETEVEILR